MIRINKNSISSIIPAKSNYFDSGNNYTVISDTSHINNNTPISLTYCVDSLGTAGGALLPIVGIGTMHELSAIFLPDSIASFTSFSQLNREREAVSIFLRQGAARRIEHGTKQLAQ